MTKRRMAINVARNISKLIIGFIWHVIIIELCIRLKWLCQNIIAIIRGYKSHAHYMQTYLNMHIQSYEATKKMYSYQEDYTQTI